MSAEEIEVLATSMVQMVQCAGDPAAGFGEAIWSEASIPVLYYGFSVLLAPSHAFSSLSGDA
jgi:hypothetical protein